MNLRQARKIINRFKKEIVYETNPKWRWIHHLEKKAFAICAKRSRNLLKKKKRRNEEIFLTSEEISEIINLALKEELTSYPKNSSSFR